MVGRSLGKCVAEIFFQALRTTSVKTQIWKSTCLSGGCILFDKPVEFDNGSEKVKNGSSSSLLEADSMAIGFLTKHKQLFQNIINTQTKPLCDHNRVRQRKRHLATTKVIKDALLQKGMSDNYFFTSDSSSSTLNPLLLR